MKSVLTMVLVAAAIPVAAQGGVISGSSQGLVYKASNNIIGQTSTATIAGGGNPIYLAQDAKYSGVVGILMDYGPIGAYVCSGSLINGGKNILTAGHCMNVDGRRPDNVTVYFYDGDPADVPVYSPGAPGVTTVGVDRVFVNRFYTGEVIDDHDVAVLRLAGAAPAFAQSYDLYTDSPVDKEFNIVGLGGRSSVGGDLGVDLGVGRRRQGINTFDFTLGDPYWGGFWDGFFGSAEVTDTLIADFDNGKDENDASCILASFFAAPGDPVPFCATGLGAREVSSAGGDSGGPEFVDGKIAAVTSFGLTFGTDFGDIDNFLNDTFGEFSGYAGVYNNLDFILGSVPTPGSLSLFGLGLGMAAGLRRRTT